MSNQDNPYGAPAGQYGSTSGSANYQASPDAGPGGQQSPPNQAQVAGNANGEIPDISTEQFVPLVVEGSKTVPVIIDFWAPWCGPCKQLTPVLENVARDFGGRVTLVKMNTEQYPDISGQMGIQSIPAVVAFVDGKPVDAFMGVKPESEVRAFFEKHAGPEVGETSEKILSDTRLLIDAEDYSGATNLLGAYLQTDPENPQALALLGSIHVKMDNLEQATLILESIASEYGELSDVAALSAALELAKQADELGDIGALIEAVEKDGSDLQAKFDLSLAYNGKGERTLAVDLLLEIVKQSREWNDDGARKQLITYFEAWGPGDEATNSGRRKLSTVLFS